MRPVGHPRDRELRPRALAGRFPSAAARAAVGEQRLERRPPVPLRRRARRGGPSRRRRRPRGRRSPASRRPAARRASPRAARSRSPPSARCGRRRPHARASRGCRCAPAANGVVEAELGDEPAGLRLERAAAEDREPRLRHVRADACECAQQRRVILLLDQAADGEGERRIARDPGRGRRRLGRRGGSSSSP